MMKKDKGKAPPKKPNEQRRAYIASESDSESSSDESSSDSDETKILCVMAHTKNHSYHNNNKNDKKVRSAYYNSF